MRVNVSSCNTVTVRNLECVQVRAGHNLNKTKLARKSGVSSRQQYVVELDLRLAR